MNKEMSKEDIIDAIYGLFSYDDLPEDLVNSLKDIVVDTCDHEIEYRATAVVKAWKTRDGEDDHSELREVDMNTAYIDCDHCNVSDYKEILRDWKILNMVKQPLFPKTEGKTSKQAHTNLPEGTVELKRGRRPRSFNLLDVKTADMEDPNETYTTVLYNSDCRISISRRKEEMPYYYRNSDGDETLFIHEGKGRFESDYGNFEYEEGDYITIPRGTSYRLIPFTSDNFYLFIEATDVAFEFPDRGMLDKVEKNETRVEENET